MQYKYHVLIILQNLHLYEICYVCSLWLRDLRMDEKYGNYFQQPIQNVRIRFFGFVHSFVIKYLNKQLFRRVISRLICGYDMQLFSSDNPSHTTSCKKSLKGRQEAGGMHICSIKTSLKWAKNIATMFGIFTNEEMSCEFYNQLLRYSETHSYV